jgi:DNA-binding transcriptional LysR family regulator
MGRKKAAITGQLSDIDLRLLRVFKTVADAGGFSAAELKLNLANSTISNHISDLESRLDMRLCDRGRSGFNLTAQGQRVYTAIQELLTAVDQFRNSVNQTHSKIIGNLELGFAEHLPWSNDDKLVNALAAMSSIAPDVYLNITTMGSDDILTAVLNRKIDLGITVLPVDYMDLETLPLYKEEMILYCGQTHPLFHQRQITTEQLNQYRFVESPRLMQGREIHPQATFWNKTAKAHHQEARTALILSGHYLGYLPEHLVKNSPIASQLKPILRKELGYHNIFYAIWRKSSTEQIVLDTFIECLYQSAKHSTPLKV